jgi:exosortase D (VPLPA-CTERM-specific)
MLSVPVFLEGNIIDLGVTKLHVAEACSGLRYLFPILSFSYIFAVLYRGPVWHKAVLLVSAAPITVFMNSVRIAIAGVVVQYWGLDWLEGFSHFFEGWVIFIACILILFGLARVMLFLNVRKMGLAEALDLDTDGLLPQVGRLRLIQASPAMILTALLMAGAAIGWQVGVSGREAIRIDRVDFNLFPRQFGQWRQEGPPHTLTLDLERALAADDYHSISLSRPEGAASVEFFSAWYSDQSKDGVHSPEICLPGGGWEIAWLQRTDVSQAMGSATPYMINRAIIQKGETRMIVYYWFEQKGRKIAWDMAAKFWLMIDGIRTGRTDGALVRLTTPILDGETDAEAEARLKSVMREIAPVLPRFIPEA